jgi:hypothetical protein
MRKLALLLLLAALPFSALDRTFAVDSTSSGIVATFDVVGETFRAHIENPSTIQQVIDLWNGQSRANIPVGKLLPGEEYNLGWSWHTDPWNIQMAEVAIELCDGRPSDVEANLDYWLYTVGMYCPWNAVLVDVMYLDHPVGGIAELPDVASTPLEAQNSSGPDAGLLAGVAAAVAAGLLALFSGAWYARRRRLRQGD